jgi:hypothetical protein
VQVRASTPWLESGGWVATRLRQARQQVPGPVAGRAVRCTSLFAGPSGAYAAGSPHGLNVHVVGVVLILVGVLGLLLPLLARGGPLNRRRLTRSIRPGGYDDSRLGERKRAAAADVAAVQENDRILSPDTPGRQDNDL